MHRIELPGTDEGDAAALVALHDWIQDVVLGEAVLLALLGVGHTLMARLLAALAPLGVPGVAPPPETKVLAAVGYHMPMEMASSASIGTEPTTSLWFATYASLDVAYAAIPWSQPAAAA